MKDVLAITRALSDETRLRVLALLRSGELCVCQIIEVIGLAPSTVSKHMTILYDAGLVERRKHGRWHYYRLARGSAATPAASRALRWIADATANDAVVTKDATRLDEMCGKELNEISACCYGR